MKIAILGDIHANIHALRAALSEASRLGCERVYHIGDLVGIGPYPAECVALAQQHDIRNVMGNHDALVADGMPAGPNEYMDDEEFMHQHWTHSRLDQSLRDYIRSFPYRIDEQINGVSFLFLHFALDGTGKAFKPVNPRGSENEIISRFSEDRVDVLCFGHLHRFIDSTVGPTRFLGLESLGCSKTPEAHFPVFEINQGEYKITQAVVRYDDSEMLNRYELLQIPAREFIFKHFLGRKPGGKQNEPPK